MVRKPGALARYRFREDLFPTLTFRTAYDALCRYRGQRADVEYVRVLHLAASTMESQVETALSELLERNQPFDYVMLKEMVEPVRPDIPEILIAAPDLKIYDQLIAEAGR